MANRRRLAGLAGIPVIGSREATGGEGINVERQYRFPSLVLKNPASATFKTAQHNVTTALLPEDY